MLSMGSIPGTRLARVSALALLWALAVFVPARTTHAEASKGAASHLSASDKDMARTNALQAFSEFDARRYDEAVERFDKAIALYDAPTLRLGRGQAHAALRKLVLAAADYRAAASHPATRGEPPSFARARREASLKYGAIQARLPRITIVVGESLPLVTLDGRVVQLEQLNTSMLLDPGPHEVVFYYYGQRTMESVVLEEGANELIRFEATALPADIASPASPTDGGVPARGEHRSGAALGATVVSGALIVGTVVVGLVTANAWREFEKLDLDDTPSASINSKRTRAVNWTWMTAGLGALAVGSAGVTTFLWLDSTPAARSEISGRSKRPWLTGAMAGLAGTF